MYITIRIFSHGTEYFEYYFTVHSLQGLQGQALRDVTLAALVAQLLYASPAWSGFIKSEEKAKLQSVLNKTARYGFLPKRSTSYLNHQILLCLKQL